MTKIKILEMFGEPITYGGQESVVYNMLSVLDLKKDFDVSLFTPYYVDNKNLIELIRESDGEIFYLNLKFLTGDNRFKLKPCIDNFFKEHKNSFDVVHIHTGSISTMLVYAMSAKKYNIKKVIVHAHNAGNKNDFKYKLFRLFISFFLQKYADVFIGCSEMAIKWRWSKFIAKKAILINNGIDVKKYKHNENYSISLREKHNLQNKFIIGNVARFTWEKNHKFMIDIIELLASKNKEFVLMLIGDGELKEEIKNIVASKNLNDKVVFVDNTNNINEYYSLFDIFILPSIYEGFGITSVEAQCAMLPSLVSDKITRECKISNKTYFLDIDNINSWVQKIIEIKNEKNKDENYKNSIKIDYEKFDREKTFKKLKEIYKNI